MQIFLKTEIFFSSIAVVYSDAGFVYVFKMMDQKLFYLGVLQSNNMHSLCFNCILLYVIIFEKPMNIIKILSVSTSQKIVSKRLKKKASQSTEILGNARTNKYLVGQLCQPDCGTRRMGELYIG